MGEFGELDEPELRERRAEAARSLIALAEESAFDALLAAEIRDRVARDSGQRTSLDDVIAAFGHTRESLAALPEDD